MEIEDSEDGHGTKIRKIKITPMEVSQMVQSHIALWRWQLRFSISGSVSQDEEEGSKSHSTFDVETLKIGFKDVHKPC